MKFEGRDIKVVWLDLDDTIIDFTTNSRHALERLREREPLLTRLFPTAPEWVDLYEHHNHALWDAYSRGGITRQLLRHERFRRPLAEAGATTEEAAEAANRYDTLYLDLLAEETALIPGSMELLRFLRKMGVKIGCLSNGFTEVQFRKIRNCGLEPWFDLVVLSDDIGFTKPDIRLFRHAMEHSGYPDPASHIMIGDNAKTDIAGAIGAGWAAIQYLRFPQAERFEACHANVDSLPAVMEMLRSDCNSAADRTGKTC